MLPPPEYDPQTVQPAAGLYINYTIQAHYMVQQVLNQKFLPTVSKYVPIFSETSLGITINYRYIFYFQIPANVRCSIYWPMGDSPLTP
jgi:hypothetical protein